MKKIPVVVVLVAIVWASVLTSCGKASRSVNVSFADSVERYIDAPKSYMHAQGAAKERKKLEKDILEFLEHCEFLVAEVFVITKHIISEKNNGNDLPVDLTQWTEDDVKKLRTKTKLKTVEELGNLYDMCLEALGDYTKGRSYLLKDNQATGRKHFEEFPKKITSKVDYLYEKTNELAALITQSNLDRTAPKTSSAGAQEKVPVVKDNYNKSIDDLLAHLGKYYTISNKTPLFAGMVDALEACKVELSDEAVEIYKFDIKTRKGKEILASAKTNKSVFLYGFNLPVAVNGSFVIYFKDVTDTAKLESVFQKF